MTDLNAVAEAVRDGLATRTPRGTAPDVPLADVPVEDVLALAEPFLTGAGGADLRDLLLELHRPEGSGEDVRCEHDGYAWPCPTADLCVAWTRPDASP